MAAIPDSFDYFYRVIFYWEQDKTMRQLMSNQTAFRQKPIVTLLLIATLAGSVTCLNAASFVVTDLADAGPGTLRQAILDANTTPGDDTISFTTNGTITLATVLPAITDNTIITGPGMNLLTVSGNSKVRIFYMLAGTTNSLSGLTVAAGYASGVYLGPPVGTRYTNAPGVANYGTLTMQRCIVRDCLSYDSYGVGLFNQGILNMQNCILSGNNMKPLFSSSGTAGGGLFNRGVASVVDCLITNCAGGWPGLETSGGGIYNATTGKLFASNTKISRCYGDRGVYGNAGGLHNSGNAVLEPVMDFDERGFKV